MNLSYAYIDGVRTRVLLDDGSQINSIMPAYAHEHNMVIGSLQELGSDPSGDLIQGMGGGVRLVRLVMWCSAYR